MILRQSLIFYKNEYKHYYKIRFLLSFFFHFYNFMENNINFKNSIEELIGLQKPIIYLITIILISNLFLFNH